MEPTTNPVTDPATNPPATSITQDDTASTPQGQEIIVGGAFGGTIPAPTNGQTMPAFSFDEDDFATVAPSSTNDPFAGGVESLHVQHADESLPVDVTKNQTSSMFHHTQETDATSSTNGQQSLDNDHTTTNDTLVSEGSAGEESSNFSLDSLTASSDSLSADKEVSTSQQNTTPLATDPSQISEEDFSLPTTSESPPPTTNFIIENTKKKSDSIPSFDAVDFILPDTEQSPQITIPEETHEEFAPTIATTQTKTTTDSGDEFNLTLSQDDKENNLSDTVTPVIETYEDTEESSSGDTITQPNEPTNSNNDEIISEQPNSVSDDTEENNPDQTEEASPDSDTVVVQEEVSEDWGDETHALTEESDELFYLMSRVQSETNTNIISVVGLRTEETEIIYTFSAQDNTIISIKNSATNDTIQFTETESGLKVSLNDEHIAYYGVEDTDDTVTHYIKEKLGKFNLMLSSELDKASQAYKEKMKRVKETLRNF